MRSRTRGSGAFSIIGTTLLWLMACGPFIEAKASVLANGFWGTFLSQRIYLRNAIEDYSLHGQRSECMGGSLVVGSTRASGKVSGLYIGFSQALLDLNYDYETDYEGIAIEAAGETEGAYQRYTVGWWYGRAQPKKPPGDICHLLVSLSREYRTYNASRTFVGDPGQGIEIELSEISFNDTNIGFGFQCGKLFTDSIFLSYTAGCELVISSGSIADYDGEGVGGNGYIGIGVGFRMPLNHPIITIQMKPRYFYNHSSIKEEHIYEVLDNTRHEIQINLALDITI